MAMFNTVTGELGRRARDRHLDGVRKDGAACRRLSTTDQISYSLHGYMDNIPHEGFAFSGYTITREDVANAFWEGWHAAGSRVFVQK